MGQAHNEVAWIGMPDSQLIKVVSGGWYTCDCFICDVAFYDLFVHSAIQCNNLLYVVLFYWTVFFDIVF